MEFTVAAGQRQKAIAGEKGIPLATTRREACRAAGSLLEFSERARPGRSHVQPAGNVKFSGIVLRASRLSDAALGDGGGAARH
jgi:hypothetical protein